jgi:hypothetical protein
MKLQEFLKYRYPVIACTGRIRADLSPAQLQPEGSRQRATGPDSALGEKSLDETESSFGLSF